MILKAKKIVVKPIRNEIRQAYCVQGCSDWPTEHRWRLFPGVWRVKCLNCLAVRKIQTNLGFYHWAHDPQERTDGPAAVARVLAFMRQRGELPKTVINRFTVAWLKEYCSLESAGIAPSEVAATLRGWELVEFTSERGVYQWVA